MRSRPPPRPATVLPEGTVVFDSDPRTVLPTVAPAPGRPPLTSLLVQDHAHAVLRWHRAERDAGADVLCALTADTTPRALERAGLARRAALLTGEAIELAQRAAGEVARPVAVAGVLEPPAPSSLALVQEAAREHALRIAAAGADLLVVRPSGEGWVDAAAVAASARVLPTWASVNARGVGTAEELAGVVEHAEELARAGAAVLFLEVRTLDELARVAAALAPRTGAPLAAVLEAVGGAAPWPTADARHAARALRAVQPGPGSRTEHTAALARWRAAS